MGRALVIGAGGDVGQGIVSVLIDRGWIVIASGRDIGRLERLQQLVRHSDRLLLLPGSISNETQAAALVTAAGPIDAAVVSVNAPNQVTRLIDYGPEALMELFRANVLTHFMAARAILPSLTDGGVLIGIGGGMADFIAPGLGHLSIAQAALRNLYRTLTTENRSPAVIKELLIASMVNGESKRARAKPDWITDREVGEHVAAILANPALFPEPVIRLSSRDQVGQAPKSAGLD